MSTSFVGPRIDGPPPIAPLYGLLQAAAAPAGGVRIVPDADGEGVERWGNGVVVSPYPTGLGDVFDACAPASTFEAKAIGDEDVPNPEFAAICAYLPVTCQARGIWNHDEFKARAVEVFSAVESALVSREFMHGYRLPSQPFLADGEGVFPNGDTVTSVRNGIALLEEAIAETGRAGVIHTSPSIVSALGGIGQAFNTEGGVIRTTVGTLIVPDAGYVGGSQPTGHPAGEWIYATGPLDVRRSAVIVNPETPSQAVDRATNETTYRVERYYLIDWDTVLQAAVLVDRCQDGCV